MGTAAISYLRIDLERYALALRRVANLGSTFFIKSTLTRMEYIQEIEDFINEVTRKFHSSFDINERRRLIIEIKSEYELAEKEYQILRMGNYEKYIVTDIFEEQGLLKYAKIGGGIITSIGQGAAGWGVYKLSRTVHSTRMKGISAVLFSHGANNLLETIYPLIYDRYLPGPTRKLYRFILEKMGYDIDDGDFAYSTVDFAVTAYSVYAGRKIVSNKNSLALRSWLDKPGTGRLFNAVSNDFQNKFNLLPRPLKIIQIGSSAYKFKVTFLDEDYKFETQQLP